MNSSPAARLARWPEVGLPTIEGTFPTAHADPINTAPSGRPVVGLVLGGGAVRGAAHIGVLRVLGREGIRFGVVTGVSVGALVGAGYSAGLDAEEMSEIARGIRRRDLARLGLLKTGMSLLETPLLISEIADRLGNRPIEDLHPRFGAVACNLATGEPVLLDRGPIGPALRASIAIPGVFPPVRIDGQMLVDGGLCDNVPVAAARKLGAQIVVAVEVGATSAAVTQPGNVIGVLRAATRVGRRLPNLATYQADIVIRPDTTSLSRTDLKGIANLEAAGERAAEEALSTLRATLGQRVSGWHPDGGDHPEFDS